MNKENINLVINQGVLEKLHSGLNAFLLLGKKNDLEIEVTDALNCGFLMINPEVNDLDLNLEAFNRKMNEFVTMYDFIAFGFNRDELDTSFSLNNLANIVAVLEEKRNANPNLITGTAEMNNDDLSLSSTNYSFNIVGQGSLKR